MTNESEHLETIRLVAWTLFTLSAVALLLLAMK